MFFMKNSINYILIMMLFYSCNQITYYNIPEENKPPLPRDCIAWEVE